MDGHRGALARRQVIVSVANRAGVCVRDESFAVQNILGLTLAGLQEKSRRASRAGVSVGGVGGAVGDVNCRAGASQQVETAQTSLASVRTRNVGLAISDCSETGSVNEDKVCSALSTRASSLVDGEAISRKSPNANVVGSDGKAGFAAGTNVGVESVAITIGDVDWGAGISAQVVVDGAGLASVSVLDVGSAISDGNGRALTTAEVKVNGAEAASVSVGQVGRTVSHLEEAGTIDHQIVGSALGAKAVCVHLEAVGREGSGAGVIGVQIKSRQAFGAGVRVCGVSIAVSDRNRHTLTVHQVELGVTSCALTSNC